MALKLLIIGAGVLQLPAIMKAREMGLSVAVVDINSAAPGVSFVDKFYQFSTNDIQGVISAAMDFHPDGVMTLATDMPVRSVAAVAEKLGLRAISPIAADKATDKVKMIQCFAEYNVPHPWFEIVSSEKEFLNVLSKRGMPFIIKPNDSSGSRGVVLVRDESEAINAYYYSKNISRTGIVLVEEFMQGLEVSVEIVKINGYCHILGVTDKLTTGAPYFVEMGHSQPSLLSDAILSVIKSIAVKAVDAIEIDNSAAHVEIIVTEEGPKLVEIGARMGGDCITTHLVPLSTGVDMVKVCIDLALGREPDVAIKFTKGAAIRYNVGILMKINGVDEVLNLPNIKHVEIVKQKGDIIKPIQCSHDRIGYVIAQNDTVEMAVHDCEEAIKKISILMN